MDTYGGPWTQKKLQILHRYLDAYTTALKRFPKFRLTYVDAFAGGGLWSPGSESGYTLSDYNDFREFHEGSPRIALGVQNKPFDRFIFIEIDPRRCSSLIQLKEEYPTWDIDIRNGEANSEISLFCNNMGCYDRAVVFLDPFATQVSWDTVAKLAQTKKVDCWILFPLSAITRMMPKANPPPEPMAEHLDRIFGGRTFWRDDVYHIHPQRNMFDDVPRQTRSPSSDQIAACYRKRLEKVFEKIAPTPRTFFNSKQSPLFEFFFAASNPKGAPIAVKIANHILQYW